jgi:hypothetical protein
MAADLVALGEPAVRRFLDVVARAGRSALPAAVIAAAVFGTPYAFSVVIDEDASAAAAELALYGLLVAWLLAIAGAAWVAGRLSLVDLDAERRQLREEVRTLEFRLERLRGTGRTPT